MGYTDEAKEAFGEFIKQHREAYSERHNRTYWPYEIAALAGMSQSMYYNVEAGMVPDGFRAIQLLRLARLLDFNLEEAATALGFPLKE